MALKVIFAVYGALRGGNQDNTEAAIVTGALQTALNNHPNGVVQINNANMGGDPAKRRWEAFRCARGSRWGADGFRLSRESNY